MNITINFTGDFWTALTAIGTIGACIIAIWGIWRNERKKISGALVWDNVTHYIPKLVLSNTCSKTIVISKVDFTYQSKNIGMLNVLQDSKYRGKNILLPGNTIELDVPVYPADKRLTEPGYRKFPGTGLYIDASIGEKSKNEHTMRIVITDINKRKYKIKQQFSEDKLSELFIGNAFLND